MTMTRPRSVRSSKGRRSSASAAVTKQQSQSPIAGTHPHALSLLASKQKAQSKSVEDLYKMGTEVRRDFTKQAWAPSPKHNLSSRSYYTPGHNEQALPPLKQSRPASNASSRPGSRLYKAKDGSSYLMINNELKSDFGRVSLVAILSTGCHGINSAPPHSVLIFAG